MLRVVVAVGAALAILGVALPAVETARRSHANQVAAEAVERLVDTARALAARNDASEGPASARRVLELSFPTASWATEGLASLTIRRLPNATASRVTWRVRGGERRTRLLARPLVVPRSGPLSLEAGGDQDLRLALRRRAGRRVVVVSRPGARRG
jgi:hypothetical protein